MSLDSQYFVPVANRPNYGMQKRIIYASSHPFYDSSCLPGPPHTSTYAPHKKIFAIGFIDPIDIEFTAAYENKIHDNVVSSIRATLLDASWDLNVLRLGFKPEPLENPITILIKVAANGGLSDDKACKIVADIVAIVAAAALSFPSELIHIDVCRACSQASSSRLGFSVLESNPEVYCSSARLPYSSVGPAQFDCQGTLGLFIQYEDPNGKKEVFALTCRHVVDPLDLLPRGLAPGQNLVNSPAKHDHETTITTMTENLYDLKADSLCLPQTEIVALEQTLQDAKSYNITFGNVYATSGCDKLLPASEGRSDWGIISITDPSIKAENKFVRSAGLFRSFKYQNSFLDFNYRHAASQYFNPGPHFKPVREDDLVPGDLVFKPRSRTTSEWTAGTYNATRATQFATGKQTRELCFISLVEKGVLSAKGDSGSILIDKNFRPVAMIWAGGLHDLADGPTDLTYASPLASIIKDIEECMGWLPGSVSIVLD